MALNFRWKFHAETQYRFLNEYLMCIVNMNVMLTVPVQKLHQAWSKINFSCTKILSLKC